MLTDDSGPAGIAPLAGIRVLDLTIVLAGPYGTRMLADLGAEVIKVDTRPARNYETDLDLTARLIGLYPNADPGKEPWNSVGLHGQLNRNKESIVLDLNSSHDKTIFLRLVEIADCVVENFTPKVMPSLGLGEGVLRAINPKLIYVAMPGFGTTGPRSSFPAYAPTTEAASGFLSLLGYEDGTLVPNPTSLADFVGGLNGMVGLMAALWNARRTGEGAFIDLSQVEAMASFIGEEFEPSGVTETERHERTTGNQLPSALLSGIFPARGYDEWIAISLSRESELQALVRFADLTVDMAAWLRSIQSEEGRAQVRSEIASWTARFGKQELAVALQAVGVPAAPVQTAPDLFADPQLNYLGFFFEVDDPVVGRFPYEGQPWHFTRWKGRFARPAPRLGSATDQIVERLPNWPNGDPSGIGLLQKTEGKTPCTRTTARDQASA